MLELELEKSVAYDITVCDLNQHLRPRLLHLNRIAPVTP